MKITLLKYKVNACGYYKPRDSDPQYGDFQKLCANMYNWLKKPGKAISHTTTHNIIPPDESEDEQEANSVDASPLCADVCKNKDGTRYLFILWLPYETHKNRSLNLDPHKPFGETASISSSKKSGSTLPGRPAYFWVDPVNEEFYEILFTKWRPGHAQFQAYFRGFITYYSGYTHTTNNPDGTRTVVYGRSPPAVGDEGDLVSPKFSSSPVRESEDLDFIRERREDIIKIIKKSKINNDSPSHRGLVTSLLNWFSGPANTNLFPDGSGLHKKRFRFAFSLTPSADQLETLIKEASSLDPEDGGWDNIGVQLTKEGRPRWLNARPYKREGFVSIKMTKHGACSAQDLLSSLEEKFIIDGKIDVDTTEL